MAEIHVLSHDTIDKIAAGEVVERPVSVVKELVENALDASADAVTVEIKDGGTTLIRVSDNGSGIEKSQLSKVFLRHATSKITDASDLKSLVTLGFRGEALSSISGVSMVELISKTKEEMTGIHVYIEGGKQEAPEEVGAPTGTTILVRNLFFNVPARKKFLKQPQTEAGYIGELLEHLALSRPDVSFCFKQNGQEKFTTSGNGNLKEVIYRIYGRDTADSLIAMDCEEEGLHISGYLGKPVLNRATRSYETYFLNGRYIKSKVISKAIEEGYQSFLMQHKYPFCVLMLELDPERVDVNVHPTKMEVRFSEDKLVYDMIVKMISKIMTEINLIPDVKLVEEKKEEKPVIKTPEPFLRKKEEERKEKPKLLDFSFDFEEDQDKELKKELLEEAAVVYDEKKAEIRQELEKAEQLQLFEEKIITQKAREEYEVLGQIFGTYWLISYQDKLLMVDQHSAHEKVYFERLMKHFRDGRVDSQNLYPPLILSLSLKEKELLNGYLEAFSKLGFEMEEFGGQEIAVRTAPVDLYGSTTKELFLSILDELMETGGPKLVSVEEKIASMSCKAAIKGNNRYSRAEAEALLDELLTLENPYVCPHGRPTMISFSQYEIEKLFKRIQ